MNTQRKSKFCWFVVTPFLKGDDRSWLSAFIHRESVGFNYVNLDYHHVRWRKRTNIAQWGDYARQAARAIFRAKHSRQTGFVTVFPQLAFTLAAFKRLSGSSQPLIAWCFNVGVLPTGIRRTLASWILEEVDFFVVHSSAEVKAISSCFRIPESKIIFLPLQRPVMPHTHAMDQASPFIVALGTAQRDYETLLNAITGLRIPLSIVASMESLAGLVIPENVTIFEKLSAAECHVLIQRSTFVVTPLKATSTAVGQVTLLDAMMYSRASISTNVVGTVDYAMGGTTTLLVPPSDVASLRDAIVKLWNDSEYRQTMEKRALNFVRDELSDEALAGHLDQILQKFEAESYRER